MVIRTRGGGTARDTIRDPYVVTCSPDPGREDLERKIPPVSLVFRSVRSPPSCLFGTTTVLPLPVHPSPPLAEVRPPNGLTLSRWCPSVRLDL